MKATYICGSLTDLLSDPWRIFRTARAAVNCLLCLFRWRPLLIFRTGEEIKVFYSKLADRCAAVVGVRPFVPHEHFDPIAHAGALAQEVDRFERNQLCHHTSFVVAVHVGSSWGSGIEIEMANTNNVRVVLLCPKGKKVSRLLRGNPAVKGIIEYEDEADALDKLEHFLRVHNWRSLDSREAGNGQAILTYPQKPA